MKADIASAGSLTTAERATLAAPLARLFPDLPDGTGTGSVGVTDYLLAALAGRYRADADAYRAILAALDRSVGGDFAGAPAGRQDVIVAALERGDLDRLPPSPDRPAFEMIWRHLEAQSIDGLPFVGPVEELPGLYVATGFSNHGFQISPVARDIAEGPEPLLAPFRPGRARTTDVNRLAAFRAEPAGA